MDFRHWLVLCCSATVALAAAGGAGEAGRVAGVVTYDGPRPKPVPVVEAGTVRQLVEVDPKTKGLKDAVVWLEGVPAPQKRPVPKDPAVMDQQNFFFVPHVAFLLEDAELGAHGGVAGLARQVGHHLGGSRAAAAIQAVHDLAFPAGQLRVLRHPAPLRVDSADVLVL